MSHRVATLNFWQLLRARKALAWAPPKRTPFSSTQRVKGWAK